MYTAGKQARMKNGWYYKKIYRPRRRKKIIQSMINDNDESRGVRRVLEER